MTGAAPLPRWALASLWCGAIANAVLPVLSARILPLVDYPGHVARLAVMLDMQRGGFFDQVYAFDSFLLPNVAFDLFGLGVGRLVGAESAARLFVAILLLLTIGGCVALGRAATGRVGLAPFSALIFLINGVLLYGLLNYLFGVAVLLWACACWLAMDQRHAVWRGCVGAVFAVLMFFAHLSAVGLFAVFIGGCTLRRIIRRDTTARAVIGGVLTAASPFVVPAMLLLASSTAGLAGNGFAYKAWGFKLTALLANFLVLSEAVDGFTFLLVIACGVLLLSKRAIALPRVLWLPAALLGLVYVALPSRVLSDALVDGRLPIAIWLLVVSTLRIALDPARTRGLAVVLSALLLVRAGAIAYDWRRDDLVYDEMRADFAKLPEGSTLFAIAGTPREVLASRWAPPLLHADALAAIDGRVFVPSMFATHGQQPIVVRPAYAASFAAQAQEPLSGATVHERDQSFAAIASAAASIAGPIFAVILDPPADLVAPKGAVVLAGGRRHLLLKLTDAGALPSPTKMNR